MQHQNYISGSSEPSVGEKTHRNIPTVSKTQHSKWSHNWLHVLIQERTMKIEPYEDTLLQIWAVGCGYVFRNMIVPSMNVLNMFMDNSTLVLDYNNVLTYASRYDL